MYVVIVCAYVKLYTDLWTEESLNEMVSAATKEAIPLPKKIKDKVLDSVIIWLMTVNINETLATQVYLKQLDGYKNVYKVSKHTSKSGQQANVIYYIGKYGECPAVISDVSPSIGVHGSASDMLKITHELFPNLSTIISVGVARGIENKVNICDVVVSSEVIHQRALRDEHGKSSTKEQTVSVKQQLIDLFDQSNRWPSYSIRKHLKGHEIAPVVKSGVILSHLVDNLAITTFVKSIASEVIAIEMEGANLFTVIDSTKANVLMIKAVSDFGDSKKKNLYQPTAALLAADLVNECLSNPQALRIFSSKLIKSN